MKNGKQPNPIHNAPWVNLAIVTPHWQSSLPGSGRLAWRLESVHTEKPSNGIASTFALRMDIQFTRNTGMFGALHRKCNVVMDSHRSFR